MNAVGDLITTALYTIFIQNLIFSFAFGTSEAIRISVKPKGFLSFALMIIGFSAAASAVCYPLEKLTAFSSLPGYLRLPVYAAVLLALYLPTAAVFRFAIKAPSGMLTSLGIAALNTLVLAVPLINRRAAYSLAGCLGSGIGAGLAFIIAAALISLNTRRLSENKDIPPAFRGTPSLFLLIGLISLGFAGFAGSSIFN